MTGDAPAGANRVGMDWMKAHRGQVIVITNSDKALGEYHHDGGMVKGKLLKWDLYNVLLLISGREVLIKQAPGMKFQAAE